MNHKNTTLAIAAIVAAVAMTAVAFAVPQQALAGGHHNHNSNSVKVDQQIGQANVCSSQPQDNTAQAAAQTNSTAAALQLAQGQGQSTVCVNEGSNSADIGH
jgi:hypothetical protein